MGTVWRAYDELLGRQVAVKELHVDPDVAAAPGAGTGPGPGRAPGAGTGPGLGPGPGAVDSTLREARAVARVHHPHIVCVHDVVQEDGVPYIVMELVEGVSLAERIAVHGPVDAREAARIGLALLSALRAAHAIGVLHRDLKPANVLLEEATGRVVLTDFGIAQLAGATTLTEDGMFLGSPEYTAPERMQGLQAGPESDLWSLGVLLCAAMTGRSPFHRDSLGGVLHAVVEAEIRPPAGTGPLLPVVRGLLERDPGRRIDAAEVERLLYACVAARADPPPDGAPAHARPEGPPGGQGGDVRQGARSHVRSHARSPVRDRAGNIARVPPPTQAGPPLGPPPGAAAPGHAPGHASPVRDAGASDMPHPTPHDAPPHSPPHTPHTPQAPHTPQDAPPPQPPQLPPLRPLTPRIPPPPPPTTSRPPTAPPSVRPRPRLVAALLAALVVTAAALVALGVLLLTTR
ncbi:serine/threonine-protein kinase [Streptomyces sp. TRM64462]|uniref:serine/threonine-protein kinase n=1 Tax=Streptomyces sp. TRM64462 TaxID=2741726 RepID=UPI0020C77165|nr:serine/threonine-protein kinase [Streptomyces sp. TRM64462]